VSYLPALIITGAALLVLVIVVVALLGRIRRFRVALAGYRARLRAEISQLQAARHDLHRQLAHVRRHDREPAAGTIGNLGETEEGHG
jgi:hypothetical protein